MTTRTESASPASTTSDGAAFVPLRLQDLDVDPSTSLPTAVDGNAYLLVRRHGWPVGQVRVAGIPADAGRDDWFAAVRAVDPVVADLATADTASPTGGAPTARTEVSTEALTVVVATLGSNPLLRAVVEASLAQDAPVHEVLVVDNDPASGATRRALDGVTDDRLHIVDEPHRGVSRARSTGLAHVRTPLVAFTDDDAVPDADWVRHTLAAFSADPAIGCVTGLVVPAELATPAQVWFEEFGGFAKGYALSVWSPQDGVECAVVPQLDDVARAAGSPVASTPGRRGAAFPYTAGEFGSGNSMAFRTEVLRAVDGFDPTLGPGTPTLGGEDLDVFRAVFLAGSTIVYQPRAIVRHTHRQGVDELRRQLYGYGTGLTAHVTKLALTRPGHVLRLLGRAPASARMLFSPTSEKNVGKSADFPAELTRVELRGIVAGPWLYLRSRRALARSGRR